MQSPNNESPVNPLPPVVVLLSLLLVVPELAFQIGARGLIGGPEAIGWRIDAITRFAFSGEVLGWMIETGRFPPEHLMRIVTYTFVHANFTHLLFALVFLLALGKMVAESFGSLAVVVVFFGSAVFGALTYGLIVQSAVPLIGAYPAVYGLIGAYTFAIWVQLGATGENQMRAFTLIALLLGIQLVFGLIFGAGYDWVGDLGGFVAGFLLSFVVVPGGWSRIKSHMRQR